MLATLAFLLPVALTPATPQDPPGPTQGEAARAAQEPEVPPPTEPDAGEPQAEEVEVAEPKTATEWFELANSLAAAIERGEAPRAEADALYPVLAMLLLVWKPAIRERMKRQARFSPRVEKHLRNRENELGFVGTAIGMAYLVALWVRRAFLKIMRKTALGRTFVAEALRQSMVRGGEDLPEATRRGFIDPAIRDQWLYGKRHIESPVREQLERVQDMVKRGWPMIAVVAERGIQAPAILHRSLEPAPVP